MNKNIEKLLSLVGVAGEINGRKKLQKIVYLLQVAGFDFGKTFRYHYFGPYSTDLQLEIDALVDRELLLETRSGSAYSYKVANIPSNGNPELFKTDQMKPLIDYLNNYESQELELAATLVYLHENHYGDFDSISKKAKILKPDLESKLPNAKIVYERIAAC